MKQLVIFVIVANILSSVSAGSSDNKAATKDWELLTFTQTWSQTFCTLSNDNNVTCQVPQAVNDWTIHGLWPGNFDGSYPAYCNNSWHFDIDEIKDLEKVMLVHWPNLLAKKAETSLWSHEWDKHGTCGATLPALNTQHNYFSKTLALRDNISISKRLEDKGIIPSSDKQYQYDNIMNSLSEVFGAMPQFECYVPLENPDVFYLGEIRLCVDKEFTIINCTKSNKVDYRKTNMVKRLKASEKKLGTREYQPCSSSKPLMIPPIKH